jgi:hypothetical protein
LNWFVSRCVGDAGVLVGWFGELRAVHCDRWSYHGCAPPQKNQFTHLGARRIDGRLARRERGVGGVDRRGEPRVGRRVLVRAVDLLVWFVCLVLEERGLVNCIVMARRFARIPETPLNAKATRPRVAPQAPSSKTKPPLYTHTTLVSRGSAASLDSDAHIVGGSPSNRRPQPSAKSVSPQKSAEAAGM